MFTQRNNQTETCFMSPQVFASIVKYHICNLY